MRLLLDTHLLLWAAGDATRLSTEAYQLLNDPTNELIFSTASLWEIIIKSELGRSDFQVNAQLMRRGLLNNGYQELMITSEHVIALTGLPHVHKDPFDRILIAQAISEEILLLSSDKLISMYSGPVRKV